MEFTGERYIPNIDWPEISYEHWHRYLYSTQFVSGKVVLDVASGEGYGSDLIAETAANVIGVDVDPKAVKHAGRKYKRSNLEFRCGAAGEIPIAGEHLFDLVVSFETIEHMDEVEQVEFLKEIKRLLKPDGILLMSTPNKLLYSDQPEYKNEYHHKEFYEGDFRAFLETEFRHVYFSGQKVYPVSYIWSPNGSLRNIAEYQLAYSDGKFGPVRDDQKELFYILAVCSNVELESPSESVLLDISERATQSRQQRLDTKDQVITQLQEKLTKSESFLEEMKAGFGEISELRLRIEAQGKKHSKTEAEAERERKELLRRNKDFQEKLSRQDNFIEETKAGFREVKELRSLIEEQGAQLKALASATDERTELLRQNQEHLGNAIREREELLQQNDELLETIYDIQAEVSEIKRIIGDQSLTDLDKGKNYTQLIRRIRKTVNNILPKDENVIVISKGDENLLNLNRRNAWHFPQDEKGNYAGSYPASSDQAIAHVEELRERGGTYFVIPATAFWWLDHYKGFAAHLTRYYRLVQETEDTCIIYALSEPGAWKTASDIITEFEKRNGRPAAILDWDTESDLDVLFPECTVFSPVGKTNGTLPYLDESIDFVAIGDPKCAAEARRVSIEAVFQLAEIGNKAGLHIYKRSDKTNPTTKLSRNGRTSNAK